MRIAVTGAFGFVGLNVVKDLASQGHQVIAIGRKAPDRWITDYLADVTDAVEYRAADLEHRGALWEALRDDQIDAVVHAAVITATTDEVERDASQQVVDVNIAGTMEALEVARAHGCRQFVYVSSPSAFGVVQTDRPIDESITPNPTTLYGISKLSSEMLVRRYGQIHDLSVVSVRIAQPYGPGERPTSSRLRTSPIYEWLVAARDRRTLVTGPMNVTRDWTFIEDTARGITYLVTAETLQHDLYHLGSGRAASVDEVVSVIEAHFPGLPRDQRTDAPGLNPNIAGQARRMPLDVSRFREEFRWAPETPIEEGLRRYFAVS